MKRKEALDLIHKRIVAHKEFYAKDQIPAWAVEAVLEAAKVRKAPSPLAMSDVVVPNEEVINAFHAGAGLGGYCEWVRPGLQSALTRAVACGIIKVEQ